MAGNISKGLCAAILLIAVVVPVEACNQSRSTPGGAAASSDEVSKVSQALIGKRITIRGRFWLAGKFGPYIELDSQQGVYLVPRRSFAWGKPYTEMDGKLVEATGTLMFHHAPPAEPTDRTVARSPAFFYFEMETTQVRLIGH